MMTPRNSWPRSPCCPPRAGRRGGGRGDPRLVRAAGPIRATSANPRARLLGPWTARQPGADAGHCRHRRRPPRHPSRMCWRWRARCCAITWPSASPLLPMASPWTTSSRASQAPTAWASPAWPSRATALVSRSQSLAARLPALLIAAERVASTVAQGVHGRRRTGLGEAFWQFRSYEPGDPPQQIDWQRSARKRPRLYPPDRMGSGADHLAMAGRLGLDALPLASRLAPETRARRAPGPGLANLLFRGGERVALMGGGPEAVLLAGRDRADGALAFAQTRSGLASHPGRAALSQIVLCEDFLSSVEEVAAALRRMPSAG